MTISDRHRERLKALHDRDPNFGVIGHRWADRVVKYLMFFDASTMLDYGAGRSNLAKAVRERAPSFLAAKLRVDEYEPAFGHLSPSKPYDFVTCIDVLEHVEKDEINNVMADLRRLTIRGALITISLRNASPKKRDTHPMVKDREWWETLVRIYFAEHFRIEEVAILDPTKAKSEVAFLVRNKCPS